MGLKFIIHIVMIIILLMSIIVSESFVTSILTFVEIMLK